MFETYCNTFLQSLSYIQSSIFFIFLNMFIVLEGIDGSGTTTQAGLLQEYFQKKNIPVFLTAEPSESAIGKNIRKILESHEKISPLAFQFLFCADRAEHVESEILPALERGDVVITDRYYLSTIAYASLIGKSEYFREVSKIFPEPDLTIFLDIAPKVALGRIDDRGEGKELFEKEEFLEKIRAAYLEEVNLISDEKKLVLDSGKLGIDEIFEGIVGRIEGGISV